MARWNVGAQAGRFIAAFGYNWPPRHRRTSRVLGVGASGRGATGEHTLHLPTHSTPSKESLQPQPTPCRPLPKSHFHADVWQAAGPLEAANLLPPTSLPLPRFEAMRWQAARPLVRHLKNRRAINQLQQQLHSTLRFHRAPPTSRAPSSSFPTSADAFRRITSILHDVFTSPRPLLPPTCSSGQGRERHRRSPLHPARLLRAPSA